MNALPVRLYRPSDRAAVLRIAADTAAFGRPVEVFLDDRRLFQEAFCAFYLDFEPMVCWVAEWDGEVAGYLTGCLDTRRHDRVWTLRVLPELTLRALRGHYRLGRLTWDYCRGMLAAALRGESTGCDLERYPAHLHINLDEKARGKGLGQGLLLAYLEQVRGLGSPGVHLHTTSMNTAACALYEKAGFRLLDRCPNRYWTARLGREVENRCYGLQLVGTPVSTP